MSTNKPKKHDNFYLDYAFFEDRGENIADFSLDIYKDVSPINAINYMGNPSDRVFDFLYTIFSYTNVPVSPIESPFDIYKFNNNVILIQAYKSIDELKRYFATQLETKDPFYRKTLWIDIHRFPRSQEEADYLKLILPHCHIITTASEALNVTFSHMIKANKWKALSKIVETTPTTAYREVNNYRYFEKASKVKTGNVLWTGNLEDLQVLASAVLPVINIPLTFCPKDDFNLEHPKLKPYGRSYRYGLHFCDMLLITQSLDDPYREQLIKEALLEGKIPCVLHTNKDCPFNNYTFKPDLKNFSKWYSELLFDNSRFIEETLLEGQKFVLERYHPEQYVSSFVDALKACEQIIITNNNREGNKK